MPINPESIFISDYDFILPEDRIARYPLPERDQSKLLIWAEKKITEDIYKNIADHLPEKSLLILNDTKVIKARLLFRKDTGGVIEIFCLEPFLEKDPSDGQYKDYKAIMNKKENVHWKCLIGGADKWKTGYLTKTFFIDEERVTLKAELVDKLPDAYVAELSWQPKKYKFEKIIEQAGEIPLPPYIKRKAETNDKERYQTIYGQHNGSVAAPTAGLHFTQDVFSSLKSKNIRTDFITLHVGAGTFKPVKTVHMGLHEMHAEWLAISAITIQRILNHKHNIIAVGTTSLRAIESLYWMGVKSLANMNYSLEELEIKQWDVYNEKPDNEVTVTTALTSLLSWMKKNQLTRIISKTQILIMPGYRFKITKGLITNFHQPKSTLLLLIAAATGNNWKEIYNYALKKNFRFLSYGDGCLLLFNDK